MRKKWLKSNSPVVQLLSSKIKSSHTANWLFKSSSTRTCAVFRSLRAIERIALFSSSIFDFSSLKEDKSLWDKRKREKGKERERETEGEGVRERKREREWEREGKRQREREREREGESEREREREKLR